MAAELLRKWLRLPDGAPWPPDHYTLLGLKPGEGNPEQVEERVLERMELLRSYQLPHPEVVTDGMNRLAQALDTLSDPDQRRKYDSGIGVRSSAAVVPPSSKEIILPDLIDLADEPDAPPPLPGARDGKGPAARRSHKGMETVPVAGYPPPIVEPLDEEEVPEVIVLEQEPEPLPLDEEPIALAPANPAREERRTRYRELAQLRKVLRVWEEIREYLTDPERSFSRRSDAVALIAALAQLRPLLPLAEQHVGGPDQPGLLVATMARQKQLGVEMFRSLLPGQRDALAKDCLSAHYTLENRYEEVRNEVRGMVRKGPIRRYWKPMMRNFGRNPEWGLLLLGGCALAIALFRSMPE